MWKITAFVVLALGLFFILFGIFFLIMGEHINSVKEYLILGTILLIIFYFRDKFIIK